MRWRRSALPLTVAAACVAAPARAQSGTVRVTAKVVAFDQSRAGLRLARELAARSPAQRAAARGRLVWVVVEPPKDGRRRVTINHLAN